MDKASIDTFFSRLAAGNPNPATELHYTNNFTLLVAVLLSAQSTDIGVNRATQELFRIVQHPRDMLALGEEKLKMHINRLGLFNTKSKNVILLSSILVEKYQGHVPHDRKALESLPGVGRKTANVVLNIAFGEETCAVDTHIFRVANRTTLARGKTPRDVEDRLIKVIPKVYRKNAHNWLILHGRYICKARRPECQQCPVFDLCRFPQKQ